jgi:hypothetical protein
LIRLAEETVEIHTSPTEDGYRKIARVKRGETLVSETVRGLELAVGELLG